MMLIKNTADEKQKFVKMVVYGPSGVGKTMLAATLPSPIMISAEAGTLSLSAENIKRVYGENANSNVPYIEVKSIADVNQVYDWLTKSAESQQYQSVVIDSISEIAEITLAGMKKTIKDGRQVYGELAATVGEVIRGFRDMHNRHIYMTAKMEKVKDEFTGMLKYGPSMPGSKLGPDMPYKMDEVFYLGVKTDPKTNSSFRFLQTAPDTQFDAKDRSGKLDAMEYPHLGMIINKIVN